MKIWKYPSSAALLINCCWSALNHGLSLNNIGSSMIWRFIHRFILKKVFSLSLSGAKHNFDELWRLIIGFFLCPQLIWILFAFLLKVHYIAPRWSTFQGVLRNVDVIFVKDLANSIDVLVWKSFLFWNQISHFNDHVYSSLIIEMKSERCLFFWNYFFPFEIQTFWSKTQHTIQCSPLIVLYLENRNDPL